MKTEKQSAKEHGKPKVLMNCYTQTADVAGRQHLRSASQRKIIVPRYRLGSYGRRCFAVAGLSTWNSLPDSWLRDSTLSQASAENSLFAKYWRVVRLWQHYNMTCCWPLRLRENNTKIIVLIRGIVNGGIGTPTRPPSWLEIFFTV